MRRLHSRQRSGVVSQQRLRPRRFDSTVKRVPKLRFEPVSFLFLVCFWIEITTSRWAIWVYLIVEDLSTWNFFILAWKELVFFKKQVSVHEFTSCFNEYEKIPGWWNFLCFTTAFPTYRILAFSKFDRLDPSYQTSKKREFDRLEKIWQFYQPSSCLSKKKRLFYLILRGKTLFFFFFKKKRKTLKINAPNSFFQNESNFFYIILDFFNKFLKTWSWTSWQKKSGDWT